MMDRNGNKLNVGDDVQLQGHFIGEEFGVDIKGEVSSDLDYALVEFLDGHVILIRPRNIDKLPMGSL